MCLLLRKKLKGINKYFILGQRGTAGISIAADWAGIETALFCEIENLSRINGQ